MGSRGRIRPNLGQPIGRLNHNAQAGTTVAAEWAGILDDLPRGANRARPSVAEPCEWSFDRHSFLWGLMAMLAKRPDKPVRRHKDPSVGSIDR